MEKKQLISTLNTATAPLLTASTHVPEASGALAQGWWSRRGHLINEFTLQLQLLGTGSQVTGAGCGGRMLISIDHTFSESSGHRGGRQHGTYPCRVYDLTRVSAETQHSSLCYTQTLRQRVISKAQLPGLPDPQQIRSDSCIFS